MAKLHRRVPRLPYLDLTLALVVALGAAPVAAQENAPAVAEPGDPALERLMTLSRGLASEEEAVRRHAYEGLITLGPEMLPAIRARIGQLSTNRPPEAWIDDMLHRFHRRGTGGEGEPDDVARGALAELGGPHPRAHEREYALQMAEPLFLWRALQAMGTDEANRAAYPLIALDGGKWMFEARNWVRRDGTRVMAAALSARSHEERLVRSWSRWAIDELDANDPGRAVQRLEDDQLADVLRAYAGLRMQSAMRVIVSYVDSDRRRVRRAAREALASYGGNAIWILRTAYRNQTGDLPPREWGFQRITDELYAHVDTQRMAAARAALEAGSTARAEGDLSAMAARFDEVLARVPELEEADPVAEGYAELAARELSEGDGAGAIAAWRRALRLAPTHRDATAWRAQIAFAEAESLRAGGVIDVDAYERVRTLAPAHEGAGAVLASVRPAARASGGPDRSTWALRASGVLALLGLVLVFLRRRGRTELDPAHASTLDAPTYDDTAAAATVAGPALEPSEVTWSDVTADATLPG